MSGFLLGVNYWASHAGVDMWREWREDIVERDLALLAQNGVNTLRVFPNWRDFQPVEPMFGGGHRLREYRMPGDQNPSNRYYLDEEMLDHFAALCRIAGKYRIKLIVGLITGWMSGRLFIPAALYDKNIFTDPAALYFQQLFIKGFVERLKSEASIWAWDLGNECNCMDDCGSREAAYSWSAMIVNAIKASDSSRPIVSGMHSLELDGLWTIQDQGELTDILTTHPYPFWVEHCQLTPLNNFRTMLHATAQTQYYAAVGRKPCMVEELGSMGPMNCDEEIAAGFLKANLWSNWANGSPGVLWWCAFDQSSLSAPPYDWNMCERELGMIDVNMKSKPSLLQMKQFAEELAALNLELPPRKTDAVCILSWKQDHWGIAYMSYLLAKQAGLSLDFAYCDQDLPDSELYFLPSVHMDNMSKRSYEALKEKVRQGATLYISVRDGIFTEFEELTGFRVVTAAKAGKEGFVSWKGGKLPYNKPHQFHIRAERAEILAADEAGCPVFGVAPYGKGRVYFLSFALEEMLLTREDGFDEPYYGIYETVAAHVLSERPFRRTNSYVGYTEHEQGEVSYAVFINYTDSPQNAGMAFRDGVSAVEAVYGCTERIEPFSTAIIKYHYESQEQEK